MAYETGTASDVNDLLSKLRTFSATNGWAENYYGARTSGTGNALQINKGGVYFTFKTDTSAGGGTDPGQYMTVYGHSTYSGGGGTESQSGAGAQTSANGLQGPFVAYHFISNSELGAEYLYCVVEVTAGTFKHFGAGTLVKVGAITNGQFHFGCRWHHGLFQINDPNASQHSIPFDSMEGIGARITPSLNCRVDADGITPRWLDSVQNAGSQRMFGGFRVGAGNQAVLFSNAASVLTGRNMIWPCFMNGERTGGNYNPLGYPPGIRWAKLLYLEPNQILTIGSDQWKVFPVIRKNGGAGQANSGLYGYAYKVN